MIRTVFQTTDALALAVATSPSLPAGAHEVADTAVISEQGEAGSLRDEYDGGLRGDFRR